MLLPMCPRPTKPIFIVGVPISADPFLESGRVSVLRLRGKIASMSPGGIEASRDPSAPLALLARSC